MVRKFTWRTVVRDIGIILLATAIILSVLSVSAILAVRSNMRWMANWWFGQQGTEIEVDFKKMHIGGIRSFTLEKFKMFPKGRPDRPIFSADNIRVRYNPKDLWRHQLELVAIEKGTLHLTEELDSLIEQSGGEKERKEKKQEEPTREWLVKNFRVENGRIEVLNIGPEIPAINMQFETMIPYLRLGGVNNKNAPPAEATIRHFEIYSPYDIFTPVLTFDSVTIKFRWADIVQKKIDAVEIEHPTIYIGEDLFWFIDYVKANKTTKPKSAVQKNWEIGKFRVENGELFLSYLGRLEMKLPIKFRNERDNLVLGTLENIHLKTVFEIIPGDYRYPEYDLDMKNLHGFMEFSIPTAAANNIVPTVHIDYLKWKDFESQNIDFSVTFDRTGVYLQYWGKAYDGQISGAGNLMLVDKVPWDGWVYVAGMDIQKITSKLSEDQFVMSGRADAKAVIKGKKKLVEEASLDIWMLGDGKMEIPPIDKLATKIPKEWIITKKDASNILLSTFRNYDFEKGKLFLRYSPTGGSGAINLTGPFGYRNIEIELRDDIFNQVGEIENK